MRGFLTQTGKQSSTLESAVTITYAQLLDRWLPELKAHSEASAAPFARLLLADIARDLADMHLGDQLSPRWCGLPRYIDVDGVGATKEHF
jgi:hypothetical protein